MRTYWTIVACGTVLMSLLALFELNFLLSAVAVPLAGWLGTKLTSEQLRRLRTTAVHITLLALIGGAILIGFGGFLHAPLLVGAGLISLLTPIFGGMAHDIATVDRECRL